VGNRTPAPTQQVTVRASPAFTGFGYDAKDQNTARNDGTTNRSFAYADAGQDERVMNNGTTQTSDVLGLAYESSGYRYLRHPTGQLLGMRKTSGSNQGNYYFLTDRLGSVTHVIDSTGVVKAEYTYGPWGETTVVSNTVPSSIRYANGYAETDGLYKFGTRYYDTADARWTQTDPIAGSINNPKMLNRYVYVGNKPTTMLGTSPPRTRTRPG
jgi:RHS repeat-associated protein